MTTITSTPFVPAQVECATQTTSPRNHPATHQVPPHASATRLEAMPAPVAILGVPFDKITTRQTLGLIAEMIASRQPHFLATANVDFVVQARYDVELRHILGEADLVLCDGMPLVWASRLLRDPLPERVAGSDLVPPLLAEAERQGWRVYFLGGSQESLARAVENVQAQFPRLPLAGAYSPPFQALLSMDHEDILERVRAAQPDILLVAFGCPKQEKWINMNFRRTGVPVSIGVGATIDFLAGSVRRAPRWMRQTGLEWVYRLLQEPGRLMGRYANDLRVFGHALISQWLCLGYSKPENPSPGHIHLEPSPAGAMQVAHCGEQLNAATLRENSDLWQAFLAEKTHVALDLSKVQHLDSTGIGWLVRLRKNLAAQSRQGVLVAPTPKVRRALATMGLDGFFAIAEGVSAAREMIRARAAEPAVVATFNATQPQMGLAWEGDVTAANEDAIWQLTQLTLEHATPGLAPVMVNLGGVRFIDSTGVRLMVRLRKAAEQRGLQLRFVEPQPAVRNVLKILRLEARLLN